MQRYSDQIAKGLTQNAGHSWWRRMTSFCPGVPKQLSRYADFPTSKMVRAGAAALFAATRMLILGILSGPMLLLLTELRGR